MSVVPIIRPLECTEEISASQGPFGAPYSLVAHMTAIAVRETRIRRDMRRLAEYDDAMLRDLGIARSDIEGVVRHGRDGPTTGA